MTFWRTITGLARRRSAKPDSAPCPDGLPGEDPAFSAAITALGAKLAKADGSADGDEYAVFAEVFHPDPESENNIHRLYDLAREPKRFVSFPGADHQDFPLEIMIPSVRGFLEQVADREARS